MNPEAQRIAIAEACGWTNCVSDSGFVDRYKGTPSETTVRVTLPDYLNDLNAMHEAEKILRQAQDYQYRASVLPAVCKDGSGMIALTATAAQRAEAFLRTLGKWEESQ